MANTEPKKIKDFPVLIPDENIRIINDMKSSMEKSKFDTLKNIIK